MSDRIVVLDLCKLDWRVRPYHPNEAWFGRAWEQEPQEALEYPARVPGDVAGDVFRAQGGPHPYSELNSRAYEWTSARDWLYRAGFDAPPLDGRRARLEFGAVDYSCTVWLNGREIGRHIGASDAFWFDVTDALVEDQNRLQVLVDAAPPEPGQIGRTSEVRTWKPRFAYGWDWNCRLVPLGIWRPVRLILHEGIWIEDLWWRQQLAADHSRADVTLIATVRCDASVHARVVAELLAPESGTVAAQSVLEMPLSGGPNEVRVPLGLESPELWWPNGYGAQPLYTASVRVEADGRSPVERRLRLGIRDIRWIRTEGAPEESLPYTPVVNGRRIYLRGFNWSPPDNLHSFAEPKFRPLAELAARCNSNILRVWGGAPVPRGAFFEACDELGILVWQEFCQSSSGIDNRPPTDDAYIRVVLREAPGIIRRCRPHTCLAAWSGGNELMDDNWVPLDARHPVLRELGLLVAEMDPDRLYLPTSASGPCAGPSLDKLGQMHDVHGPWLYAGPVEHYRLWDGVDALLHSEMGCAGAANLSTVREYIPEDKLWPPDESNPMWVYHGAWWINRVQIEELFGPIADIETFITASQYMQAEGLRYACEAARRRKWRCAGTLIWQLEEAYPNTSCTNVVDYALRTKPAFCAVRAAYAPLSVSAKYAGLGWHGKECFEALVFLASSCGAPKCVVTAAIILLDGTVAWQEERTVHAEAGSCAAVMKVQWPIGDHRLFVLRLTAAAPDASACSDIMFSAQEPPLFGGVFGLPKACVRMSEQAGEIVLGNQSDTLALPLAVELHPTDGSVVTPEANLFALRPGEERVVARGVQTADVSVRGFNVMVTRS